MWLTDLIQNGDTKGLRERLQSQRELANQGLALSDCDDDENGPLAHPLHRLCDFVFAGHITDAQAVELAQVFLAAGALVNGSDHEKRDLHDTPLIAAASLHAEQTGILYVESGADIHHRGCHGGTALHWAAWCGCDGLTRTLIEHGANIHARCVEHGGTPLLWTVHGYKFGGSADKRQHQIECARLLVQAGSDTQVTNSEGTPLRDFLDETDTDMLAVII
jgi:uncharacterized protein